MDSLSFGYLDLKSCGAMAYHQRMEPHVKVWVELNGKIVLGDFRVELLALIEETGSLRDAAARLGLSYRRAWGKIREIEANLGVKLVESAIGGSGGGGSSRLTDEAKQLVQSYRRLDDAMQSHLANEFDRVFKP
jgi:molybdate transport system regulatory protein